LVHNQDRIGITMCIQTCNNIRMWTWRIMIHTKSCLALSSLMLLEPIQMQSEYLLSSMSFKSLSSSS
jgi:hypothetical protein